MKISGKHIFIGLAIVTLGFILFSSGGFRGNLSSSAIFVPQTTEAPRSSESDNSSSKPSEFYSRITYSGKIGNQIGQQPKSQCDNTINNYIVQLKPTFQDVMSQPIETCEVLRDGVQAWGLDREAQISGNSEEMRAIRACEQKRDLFYATQKIAFNRCENTLKQYAINPSHFTVQCPSCPPGSEGCQPFPIELAKQYPDTPEKLKEASGFFYQRAGVVDEERSFKGPKGEIIKYVIRTTTYVFNCGANEKKQVIFQGGCKGCVEKCTSLICPGDLLEESSC